jgi:hypothetical protein
MENVDMAAGRVSERRDRIGCELNLLQYERVKILIGC